MESDLDLEMRILAIGDPHRELRRDLSEVVEKYKPDIIFCTGDYRVIDPDFRQFQIDNEQQIKRLIKSGMSWEKVMRKLYGSKKFDALTRRDRTNWEWQIEELSNFKIPFLTVRGNLDRRELLEPETARYKNAHYLHGNLFKYYDFNFVGIGVFHSDSFPEEKRFDLNAKARLRYYFKNKKNVVFLTHEPPYGILDKAHNGEHIGIKLFNKYINKYHPLLCICGHVHEARGTKVGKTTVVNCGAKGAYAMIDLTPKQVKVKTYKGK